MIDKSKELDQYYTNIDISKKCCKTLKNIIGENIYFLESSAGNGSFIDAIKATFQKTRIFAYDIDPMREDILKQDFLKLKNLPEQTNKNDLVVIGNPPFGKRSKLAIDFFNHSANFGNTIAFIVPIQFQKYGVQKKLNSEFSLIHNEILPENSFTIDGKPASIRCVFQIWTKKDISLPNLRIITPPKISHQDFDMFLYNNTPQARKFFDKKRYGWNFAVYRQGFYDYSKRITEESDLDPKIQYIFFRTKDNKTLEKLLSIDFTKLSQKNTTIPGFGKADIVEEYERIT